MYKICKNINLTNFIIKIKSLLDLRHPKEKATEIYFIDKSLLLGNTGFPQVLRNYLLHNKYQTGTTHLFIVFTPYFLTLTL